MKIRQTLAVVLSLTMEVCGAQSEDIPAAPPTASEAEASGLQRVGSQELGERYGGTRWLVTDKGQIVRLRLHADGSLEYQDDNGAPTRVIGSCNGAKAARCAGAIPSRWAAVPA